MQVNEKNNNNNIFFRKNIFYVYRCRIRCSDRGVSMLTYTTRDLNKFIFIIFIFLRSLLCEDLPNNIYLMHMMEKKCMEQSTLLHRLQQRKLKSSHLEKERRLSSNEKTDIS